MHRCLQRILSSQEALRDAPALSHGTSDDGTSDDGTADDVCWSDVYWHAACWNDGKPIYVFNYTVHANGHTDAKRAANTSSHNVATGAMDRGQAHRQAFQRCRA